MTTPAKIVANRQNALRSTGPRTPVGKVMACQNARTHGLLSRAVLLPDDDAQHLAAIRHGLHAELAPIGDLETLLVDRLVACAWRLRRLHTVEARVFEHERRDCDGTDEGLGHAFLKASYGGTDAFSKLARYEATHERAFYRALHELQRLQGARAGMSVPPPVAVDVDVTIAHLDIDEDG